MAQMELVHEFGNQEKLIGQASYGSQFEDDSKSNYSLDEKGNVKLMKQDKKLYLII